MLLLPVPLLPVFYTTPHWFLLSSNDINWKIFNLIFQNFQNYLIFKLLIVTKNVTNHMGSISFNFCEHHIVSFESPYLLHDSMRKTDSYNWILQESLGKLIVILSEFEALLF